MTLPNPDDATYDVYTTFQPDVRQTVSQREYDELKAQGLIAREAEEPKVERQPPSGTSRGASSSS